MPGSISPAAAPLISGPTTFRLARSRSASPGRGAGEACLRPGRPCRTLASALAGGPRPQSRPGHRQGRSGPACGWRASARDHPAGRTFRTPKPGQLGCRPDDPHEPGENLLPVLPEEEGYLALFHGARRVAADVRVSRHGGIVPPSPVNPIWRCSNGGCGIGRGCGTERRQSGPSSRRLPPGQRLRPGDLLVTAATDRVYGDGGHLLDFINKACECLDLIGWEHAAAVLPSVVGQLVLGAGSRGGDGRAPSDRPCRPVRGDRWRGYRVWLRV